MISRKSVPFAGGPVLLQGAEFHDIQKLIMDGYAGDELARLLGEKSLDFPASWTILGNPGQLTALTQQRNQGRLIVPLTGQSFAMSLRPRSLHPDAVIFRLTAGQGEAAWIPSNSALGFYFLSQSLILVAATEFRNPHTVSLDPREKRWAIDLLALTGRKDLSISQLCAV